MFAFPSRPRVITAALFFVCAVILVVGGSARKLGLFSRTSQSMLPRVTNKTSSVRISNVRQLNNGDVEVTLLNQSTKAIYAYTMITSEHPTRKGITAFATAAPVAPGETTAERIPGGNLESAAARNPDGVAEIVVSAVYFEGGIAEGDAGDSEKLKRTMGGMKEQSKLALRVLRDARTSPEQDATRLLDAVESQAASMPVKDESAPSSHEREFGRASVNDRLLGEIKKLQKRKASPGFDAKSQLSELISYYERLAEKL
jgi:hypothetical protein